MSKDEPKEQKTQELKFSQEQCELLKRCCDRGNMDEWNMWRATHPEDDVLLEGVNLKGRYLKDVRLDASPESGFCGKAYLRKAKMHGAHLEDADLSDCDLQGAKLIGAYLNGCHFRHAHLEGADFSRAIVDGETLVFRCVINEDTKFEGVGLGNMRIYPKDKQLLEYNIRRMNWEVWYKEHKFLRWPVRAFWLLSDYGLKTWPLIVSFFGLAVLFALIYCIFPKCVKVYGEIGDIQGFLHTFYFSVVTMTTLGFGDIAANPDSSFGQILLMVQVILGYVLLGSLVTRFAVLFTAGGPAGKFNQVNK